MSRFSAFFSFAACFALFTCCPDILTAATPAPGKAPAAAKPPLMSTVASSKLMPSVRNEKSFTDPVRAKVLIMQRNELLQKLQMERNKFLISDVVRAYKIREGDSLSTIASRIGVTAKALADYNGIAHDKTPPAGSTIYISAQFLNREIVKKTDALSAIFRQKRSLCDMTRDLALHEQKIQRLKPASTPDPNAPKEPSKDSTPVSQVIFNPRVPTNLNPADYEDVEYAATLFKLREDCLMKIYAEQINIIRTDRKARDITAEIMKISKEMAILFEDRPSVREITREIRLIDAELCALTPPPQPVKPVQAVKTPQPASSAQPAKK